MQDFVEQFLKPTWPWLGIVAPRFTWVAAILLLVLTFGMLLWLVWKVFQITRLLAAPTRTLRALGREISLLPGAGLSLQDFDRVDRIFDGSPELRDAWRRYRTQCVFGRNAGGVDQVWVAGSADVGFSDAEVIGTRINRPFFSAIPSIVTGAGLLFTFIAILVALMEVKLEATQVKGLDLLIQGLSGKFISSIAALFVATVYLLAEKPLFHRLSRSRQELAGALNGLFPVRSSTQLLARLLHDISEQSTAFRSFNADLSQKLRQGFSESMGPTLDRMVTAVEDLNQVLRAAEAQKQDSITGSLESMLGKLEISITKSLREMTSQFTQTLSTGAQTEFASVTTSLGNTAGLLEKMNTQFLATQHALEELTDLSRRTTTEQIQHGRSQIDDLTSVLTALMAQLNETAGSSVSRMATTLTGVVHDLSTKVSALGDKMANSVLESAGLATGAASDVIEKAEQWSEKSSAKLAELIDAHHREVGTVKDLRVELEHSLLGFRDAIKEYGTLSEGLRELVANASGATTSMAGAAKFLRDTQTSTERVAGLAATQVTQLSDANRAQSQAWQEIQRSMEQYKQVFARVQTEASALLSTISTHLANHVDVSRKGFEALATISDEHFANATKKLGSTVSELDETLQDLFDGVGKMVKDKGKGSDA